MIMQASLVVLDGLKRQLEVQLPAEQFESALQQRLQTLAKSSKLNGFRKGKVPMKVIQQRYGNSVKQEILANLIQHSFQQAARDQNLKPACAPRITSTSAEPGHDVKYTALFEISPDYEIADLSKINVTKPVVAITDSDVDNTLEKLRLQQADWETVTRGATTGDQVKIDFAGTTSGEAFAGSNGSNTVITLGEQQMPADFEQKLDGIKKGEQRTIEIVFPADFANTSLQGKQATYAVDCKDVYEPQLPDLDEAFAKLYGFEDGSVDSLRAGVKLQLEKELTKNIQSHINKQVMDSVIELHDIPLPEMLIENHINQLQYETLQRMGLKETDKERLPQAHFAARARKLVHMGIVGARLVDEMHIVANKQAVQGKIEAAICDYEDPEEMLRYYQKNPDAMERFRLLAVEDQLVAEILKQAQVNEQQMSFDELIAFNTK